jgi:DNA-binding MarR family transcriptional regulator
METTHIIHTFLKVISWASERSKTAKNYGTKEKLYIAEVHTIELIGENPGISQRVLSEKLGVTKGRMSIIVSHLEKKNLVVRQRDEGQSSKEVPVRLTKMGECIFEKHEKQKSERLNKINQVLAKCTQEELDKFNVVLEEVLEILK